LSAGRALQSGVVLLALTLVAAALVRRVTVLPGFVLDFVSEGLTVLGWVGLWQPAVSGLAAGSEDGNGLGAARATVSSSRRLAPSLQRGYR